MHVDKEGDRTTSMRGAAAAHATPHRISQDDFEGVFLGFQSSKRKEPTSDSDEESPSGLQPPMRCIAIDEHNTTQPVEADNALFVDEEANAMYPDDGLNYDSFHDIDHQDTDIGDINGASNQRGDWHTPTPDMCT